MDIQIKRGTKEELNTHGLLKEGEFGFCKDTKELFIGTGTENEPINNNQFEPITHTQSVPADTWTIILPASFNKNPNTVIYDSAGTRVFCEERYNEETRTVTLLFSSLFSGKATID